MVQPIPQGYHTLTPSIVFKNSRQAVEFYKKAFGAQELDIVPGPNGQGVMHGTMRVGDSLFMFSDELFGPGCRSAQTFGGSPVAFYLYVPDVDAAFKKAMSAGAEMVMPVTNMFWGDRFCSVKDPFGYTWSIATHIKDVTPEALRKAAADACAEMAKKMAGKV